MAETRAYTESRAARAAHVPSENEVFEVRRVRASRVRAGSGVSCPPLSSTRRLAPLACGVRVMCKVYAYGTARRRRPERRYRVRGRKAGLKGTSTGSFFAFGPSSVLGPRAADDALLLRLQRTGVRSSRRGQVGGLDQQER